MISSLGVSLTCTAGGGGEGGAVGVQSVVYTTECPAPVLLALSTIISKYFNNTYYIIL